MNQLRKYFVFAVLVLSACILYVLKSKTNEPAPTTRTVTLPKIEIEEEVRGNIVIIIDDFGYRDDNVSEGFLLLDANLTFAVKPGHIIARCSQQKRNRGASRLLYICRWNPQKKPQAKKNICYPPQ